MAVDIDRDPMAIPNASSVTTGRVRFDAPNAASPIADPAPVGLIALALTTLIFNLFNTGLLSRAGEPIVLALAVVYGGVIELGAGVWELRRGNSFGAMTFMSYAAFWLSYWVLEQFIVGRIPAADSGHAVGAFMIVWGVFSASLWVVSLRTTAAVSTMLLMLAVSLVLLGIGISGAHADLVKIGGGFGLATAVAGWYAAFGGLINSVFGRTLLPLVPLRER